MHMYSVLTVFKGVSDLDRDVYVHIIEAPSKEEAQEKMMTICPEVPLEIKIKAINLYPSSDPTLIAMTTLLIAVSG